MAAAKTSAPSSSTATNNDASRPTITPECEIVYEGGPGLSELFQGCKKNPGHKDCIPIGDLTINHLPTEWQTPEHMDLIRYYCDMTVKVRVQYTSPNRPDTIPCKDSPYPYSDKKGRAHAARHGTGIVKTISPLIIGQKCPCKLCKTSEQPHMKYWEVLIDTSTHVVYDCYEADRTVVEWGYDSDDQRVQCLYGVGTNAKGVTTFANDLGDYSHFTCVTHDGCLWKTLYDIFVKRWDLPVTRLGTKWGFIVSHPHGRSKHVSFGHVLKANALFNNETLNYLKPNSTKSSRRKRRLLCRLPLAALNDTGLASGNEAAYESAYKSLISSQRPNPENLVKPALMKPDKIYRLPDETQFILPGGDLFRLAMHPADIGFEFPIRMDEKRLREWVTLPTITILTFPNGNSRCLQQDTEFNWPIDMKHPLSCCLVHNIPTCPGSSGAGLVYHKNRSTITHYGASDSETKFNFTCGGLFPSVSYPDDAVGIDLLCHRLMPWSIYHKRPGSTNP